MPDPHAPTSQASKPSAGEDRDGAACAAAEAADPEPEPEPESGWGPQRSPLEIGVALQTELPDGLRDRDGQRLARWLVRGIACVARHAGVTDGSLSIAIVDDARMTALHNQYHGLDSTTDVLTFDLRDAPADGADDDFTVVEGEVIICLDEAIRQADDRGHDPAMELLLYAVHGLLHLTGYDDLTEADAAEMHQREDALLTAAGFDPVYAGSGGATPGREPTHPDSPTRGRRHAGDAATHPCP